MSSSPWRRSHQDSDKQWLLLSERKHGQLIGLHAAGSCMLVWGGATCSLMWPNGLGSGLDPAAPSDWLRNLFGFMFRIQTPRGITVSGRVSAIWFNSHTGILIYANFTISKPAFLPQNTRSDWIEIGMDLANNKYRSVNTH